MKKIKKDKIDIPAWVRGLKVEDAVNLVYADDSTETAIVDRIFHQGFTSRNGDFKGQLLVEVGTRLYGEKGNALGIPAKGAQFICSTAGFPLRIAPLTEAEQENEAKRCLITYITEDMGYDQWYSLSLEDLKMIFQKATGNDWDKEE